MRCDDSSTRNNCVENLENEKNCTFHFFFSRHSLLVLWDFIYLVYLCICVDMVNVSGYQSRFQLQRYRIKFFLFFLLSSNIRNWTVRRSRLRVENFVMLAELLTYWIQGKWEGGWLELMGVFIWPKFLKNQKSSLHYLFLKVRSEFQGTKVIGIILQMLSTSKDLWLGKHLSWIFICFSKHFERIKEKNYVLLYTSQEFAEIFLYFTRICRNGNRCLLDIL
jgi:hypothetical protein